MSEVHVKMQRQLLIMPETDLMKCLALRPDIYRAAVGRGKGYIRAMSAAARQAEGFDQWELYEVLKGNRPIDKDMFTWINGMPVHELREGVIAYVERLKQIPQQIRSET